MSDIKKLDPILPGQITIDNIDDYEQETVDTIVQIDNAINELNDNVDNLRTFFSDNKMRFISSSQPDVRIEGAAWFKLS